MTRARTIAATRRGLSAFLGAALVVALTVLAAPPATSGTSATPWLPEVEASDGSGVVGQVVSAIGPDGSFVVAWAERAVGDQTSMRLLVATRGPGAAGFSAPVEAAPAGGRVSDVVVVADATGATTVAWVREGTTDDRVEAARRPPGRTSFGAPETIAVASDGMRDVEGVGDAAGRVTLAWLAVVSTDLGPVPQAQSATREPVFAEWSTPIVLTPTEGHAFGLRLTADGAGAVTAAWLLFVSGDFLVQSRTRPAGSAVFPAVQTHSAPDGWAPFMDLASNAPGAASLVWWQLEGSSYVLRAADRSPGAGSFGAPVVVATIAADQVHRGPLVALDGAGTVTIIWTRRQGQDQFGVWAATRPVGGSFTAPALVATSAGPIDGLSLSSSAGTKAGAGVTVLAWTETLHPGSNSRLVRATYRPAGGEFGTAVDLTAPVAGRDDGAVAAVDAAGDAHVVWRRRSWDEAFPSHVYARTLDVTAPGLHDVAVPATGAAGATAAMSATATELWSGPPSISWDFGDGGTGTGGSTSHVYAAAGTYLVRVTATDGAGNSTSVTRTIVVGPATMDSTPPVLSGARLRPGLLPTGEGARLTVTSTERAALAGVVQRKRDGSWRAVGTKRWSLRGGANDRIFYGKTSEQRLRSGKYRVRLTATDPAGNTSATTTIRFSVDRR